jgi:membrane protease YdiL (CAAX protease family)
MTSRQPENGNAGTFVRRHPVVAYFALTYAISWSGAFLVVAPRVLRHQAIPKIDGIIMFPVMLVGPVFSGILLTRIVDGASGLRDLFSRVRRVQLPVRWYVALLIPPSLILSVLLGLKTFVSPAFAPNFFLMGLLFGVPAGVFEEIGWTGYAFPKMSRRFGGLTASILLGLLWGLWHLPVIDYLGTATPHGAYWFRYFLAFTAAMTAMRVLIGWIYINTESVLLAQLMHISSTGSLVIFSPPRATAGQETLWYLVYAIGLWIIAMIVARNLKRGSTPRA